MSTNSLISTDTNGDINVNPDGAGVLIFSDLTATTVPYLGSSKELLSSSVTPTELGYVSGVTSSLQTQLDAKLFINSTVNLNLLTENEVRFQDQTGGEYMGFKAPAVVTSSTSFTLPDGDGNNGQALITNGSTVLSWGDAGGGGGAKNYFDTGMTDLDSGVTTGFEVYQDSGYVDGTGGTAATLTIAATSTSGELLEGVNSLKILKAATDALDEGVSLVTRTIDPADYGRDQIVTMEIDFSNSTSGDFNVYAYDVTNGAILSVIGLDNGIPALKGKIQFRVLTDGTVGAETVTYRLSIHCDTDSASGAAYNVFVDDYKAGLNKSLPGYISHGPKDFTPTFPSGGFTLGNGTISVANYSREGKYMLGRIQVILGSTSVMGTSPRIEIPESKSIDADFLVVGSTADIGSADIVDLGTAHHEAVVRSYDSTHIEFRYIDAAAAAARVNTVTSTQPMSWATSDAFDFEFRIPIEGWNTTNLISTTENLFKNVDVTGEGNGGGAMTINVTDIDFTTVTNELGLWSGTAFTPKESGKYRFIGAVSTTATGTPSIRAYVDPLGVGSPVVAKRFGVTTNAATGHPFIGEIDLNAGDILTIRMTTALTLSDNDVNHWISISSVKESSFTGTYLDKLKTQTKYLTADTSSTGVMTDLTFSNLTVGLWYEANLFVLTDATTGSDPLVYIVHDGSNIDMIKFTDQGGAVNLGATVFHTTVKFQATNTTLTFNHQSGGTVTISGNSTDIETKVNLTELIQMQTFTGW